MENIISKELLSEVMGYPLSNNIDECGITRVIGLNESGADGSLDLDFGYQGLESSHGRYINVYQLANKCKEWAYNQGYMMKIENHYLNSIQIQIRKPTANSMYKEPWKKTFENEIEGMIQVCQWILDKKA